MNVKSVYTILYSNCDALWNQDTESKSSAPVTQGRRLDPYRIIYLPPGKHLLSYKHS